MELQVPGHTFYTQQLTIILKNLVEKMLGPSFPGDSMVTIKCAFHSSVLQYLIHHEGSTDNKITITLFY